MEGGAPSPPQEVLQEPVAYLNIYGGKQLDQPRKIMLVEDESHIGATLKLMLKRIGFETEIFSTGEQALAHLQSVADQGDTQPALIISDYHLPDVCGLEVFRRAKQLGLDFPKLLISGDVSDQGVDQWREVPGGYFLSKPFTFKELMAVVNEAVGMEEG